MLTSTFLIILSKLHLLVPLFEYLLIIIDSTYKALNVAEIDKKIELSN
jgi:hypothetical protein